MSTGYIGYSARLIHIQCKASGKPGYANIGLRTLKQHCVEIGVLCDLVPPTVSKRKASL